MSRLERVPRDRELEQLIKLFLKAETEIINEIGRLRSMGLVDYHVVAALERVQRILRELTADCWEYVPKMIEKRFYVRVPEARKILEPVEKHKKGYQNAEALTATQWAVVDRLVQNLMGEITEATVKARAFLENALIGRLDNDVFRRVGLEQVAVMKAKGEGAIKRAREFVETLKREGLTCFIDKAGRKWSLETYCTMVARTTSRQADILAVLTADPEQDLYQISSHNTTCALCAPYEGRVYSRSGTDPVFPPLAAAFGKIDPNGPDGLLNSYFNIHPNCLHTLLAWTPMGRTAEEIEKIKKFSSFKTNPPTKDPRSEAEKEAYHKKELARARWLRTYRQWERYRLALGDKVPRRYQTFEKHKQDNDEKYKAWQKMYRAANAQTEHG